MNITITRFVKFENEGALKAFCDVTVSNLVLIKGIRVVEGKCGPFVSMPRQLSKNGKWYDSVVPLSQEIKRQLHRTVLEAFKGYHMAPSTSTPNTHTQSTGDVL